MSSSNRPIEEYRISQTIKIAVWPSDKSATPTFSIEKLFWDRKINTYRTSKVLFMNELSHIFICIAKVLSKYGIVELEAAMAEVERIYRASREDKNAVTILKNSTERDRVIKVNLGGV